MQHYGSNKLRTVWEIVRRIENWPAALDLRIRRRHRGLTLLRFRNGLNIVCRSGTRDWDVIHELLFAAGYESAFRYLRGLEGSPTVLDLGGNIGLFSLLTALNHPQSKVYAYEPGPPNYRLFEMNCLANPNFSDRIHLRKEAVGGETRTAEWFFDEQNPGGSGLSNKEGKSFRVQINSWTDVVMKLPGSRVALAKIDIEGAEFELLAKTSAQIWERISAISLELHDDPEGRIAGPEFLKQLVGFGFKVEEESVCSYFLSRP